jgi:hypothetical protein
MQYMSKWIFLLAIGFCLVSEQNLLAQPVFPPATQQEVNDGVLRTKFVSPLTLKNNLGTNGGGLIYKTNLQPYAAALGRDAIQVVTVTNFTRLFTNWSTATSTNLIADISGTNGSIRVTNDGFYEISMTVNYRYNTNINVTRTNYFMVTTNLGSVGTNVTGIGFASTTFMNTNYVTGGSDSLIFMPSNTYVSLGFWNIATLPTNDVAIENARLMVSLTPGSVLGGITVIGGVASISTNGNQFGPSVTITIKDGAQVTNLNTLGMTNTGSMSNSSHLYVGGSLYSGGGLTNVGTFTNSGNVWIGGPQRNFGQVDIGAQLNVSGGAAFSGPVTNFNSFLQNSVSLFLDTVEIAANLQVGQASFFTNTINALTNISAKGTTYVNRLVVPNIATNKLFFQDTIGAGTTNLVGLGIGANLSISGGNLVGTAGGSSAVWSNMLFVMLTGDNATATRNRQDLPWRTISTAVAAALPGDVVFVMPGHYTVSSTINLPTNTALIGASRNQVVIDNFLNTVPAIVPRDNCYVGNLTITNVNKDTDSQMCIGSTTTSPAATNVWVENLTMYGDSDCIYIQNTNSTWNFQNCWGLSKFDVAAILTPTTSTTTNTINFYNCNMKSIGPSVFLLSASADGLKAQTNTIVNSYNSYWYGSTNAIVLDGCTVNFKDSTVEGGPFSLTSGFETINWSKPNGLSNGANITITDQGGQTGIKVISSTGSTNNATLNAGTFLLTNSFINPWHAAFQGPVATTNYLYATNGNSQFYSLATSSNIQFVPWTGSDASNDVGVAAAFTQNGTGGFYPTNNGIVIPINTNANRSTLVYFSIANGVTNVSVAYPFSMNLAQNLDGIEFNTASGTYTNRDSSGTGAFARTNVPTFNNLNANGVSRFIVASGPAITATEMIVTNQVGYGIGTVLGLGGANTNFTILENNDESVIYVNAGTTNVHLTIMNINDSVEYRGSIILTNRTGTSRTFSLSPITNNWISLQQYDGIQAPFTVTNSQAARFEWAAVGTNVQYAYKPMALPSN